MKTDKSLTLNSPVGVEITDPAIIAAAETAKAKVQAAYIMAYKKPRNFDESRARILESCRRPEFAERVEYSKPVAGKAIKGPSIRFAETAIRLWENVLIESQVVYEDDFVRRVRVSCLDLEMNTQYSKDIQIRKTIERKSKKGRDESDILGERLNSRGETVYIVKATDDELQNKEAALISKAIRNEGLRLLPSDIIDEAIKVARETVRQSDAKDPNAAKKRIIDSFTALHVYPRDLEAYLNHSLDTISPAELKELRDIYVAISSGEATWNSYIAYQQEPQESMTDQEPNEIEEEFNKLIKNYTGKIPAQWGQSLADFITQVAKNQEPSLTIEQFKANINKDNVEDFWQSYRNYVIKESGEIKEETKEEGNEVAEEIVEPTEMPPLPEIKPQEPEKSTATDMQPNFFDSMDFTKEKLNKTKMRNIFLEHLTEWEMASIKAQKAFKSKWHEVFPETTEKGKLKQPFPLPINDEDKEESREETMPADVDLLESDINEPEILPTPPQEQGDDGLRYDEILAGYMETMPEKYLMACENCGYSTMIVPTGKNAQKELYEMYNSL